jgi:DEAD/DEAH box helicase domain-containing protein
LTNRVAYAQPSGGPYYTETKEIHDIHILNVRAKKTVGPVEVSVGDVDVTIDVVGFKKYRQFSEEVLGEEPLDLPTIQFKTVALWFGVPSQASARIASGGLDFAGGLHATEHAAIGILPLFALCDRNDIGGVSTPLQPGYRRCGIFIYMLTPAASASRKGLRHDRGAVAGHHARYLRECPCEEGCPSCVQSPKCGNNNKPLDKAAAKIIMEELQSG